MTLPNKFSQRTQKSKRPEKLEMKDVKIDITVTKPSLPELQEFVEYLKKIWMSGQLTNGGGLHAELERRVSEYLGVEHASLFCNGTIALMTALRSLDLGAGEVITTPFSFAATAHAIAWNQMTPVFVDIDPGSLNIDPQQVKKAITRRTTAIMPVHVYGRPCEMDELEKIAQEHGLKLIADAAHAFGVQCDCGRLWEKGDLNVLSFHATKAFHTVEGGLVIANSRAQKERIDQLKNFGIASAAEIRPVGLNGKMNELQAAMGLAQLDNFEREIENRRRIDERYRTGLAGVEGIAFLTPDSSLKRNYAYFPIRVTADHHLGRDKLVEKLASNGIEVRKYFSPLLTDIYSEQKNTRGATYPVAQLAAKEVLCLPIYSTLTRDDQQRVISVLTDLN